MEKKKQNKIIEDVINDLKKKSDDIDKACQNVPPEIAEKVAYVRNKTVKILQDVEKKVSAISRTQSSDAEIAKAVETVRSKSDDLYASAMKKINNLKKNTDISNKVQKAKSVAGDIAGQSLETLRGWLQPDGDKK